MASADAFEQLVKAQFDKVLGCILAEHRRVLKELETRLPTFSAEKSFQQQETALCEDPTAVLPGSLPAHDLAVKQSTMLSSTLGAPVRQWSEEVVNVAGAKPCALDTLGPLTRPPPRAAHAHQPPPEKDEECISLMNSLPSATDVNMGAPACLSVSERWGNPHKGAFNAGCTTSCFMSNSRLFVEDIYNNLDMEVHSEGPLRHIMLRPTSTRFLCWEIVGFAAIGYDIITVPLQILGPLHSTIPLTMSWLIRIFWTLDIFVSFITGHIMPNGAVDLRPAEVAWQYLRTWFFIDLLLVSCGWVEAVIATIEGDGGSSDAAVLSVLGMLRAIRLVRIVRLMREQKISEFIFEHVRSEGMRLSTYIISIITVLLCLVHVITCLWHGVRAISDGHPDSEALSLTASYFLSFHHVLSLFSGEQVLEPRNLLERIFVIVVLVFAFVVSGAFVGSLTSAMIQLQIIASKRSAQFAALSHYLSDCDISRTLAARVHRNARHALMEQQRHMQESSVELMVLISDQLKSEIHYEVYSPTLILHPFFRLYNRLNPVGVRQICHTALSPISVSRGDVVFSEYEVAVVPRMFFVVSGQLVYVQGGDNRQDVEPKQWVAEAVLWTNWTHQGTLQALTHCRLLALHAGRLAKIMSAFPTHHAMDYALKYVEGLNRITKSAELTDMPGGFEQLRDMAVRVFLKLDNHFELPFEWNSARRQSRRQSATSVASAWVPSRWSQRASRASRGSQITPVVPDWDC